MEGLIKLGGFITLVLVGYFVGNCKEKSHYKSIIRREKKFLKRPTLSTKKTNYKNHEIIKSDLATGNVVISIDYFKRIIAALCNLVGGRVTPYESILDRGRREAILRMKESSTWADAYVNLRIEASSISSRSQKNNTGCIEVYAYATAIKLRPKELSAS